MHGCSLPVYKPMTHDYHTDLMADALQITVTVNKLKVPEYTTCMLWLKKLLSSSFSCCLHLHLHYMANDGDK